MKGDVAGISFSNEERVPQRTSRVDTGGRMNGIRSRQCAANKEQSLEALYKGELNNVQKRRRMRAGEWKSYSMVNERDCPKIVHFGFDLAGVQ